MPLPDNLELPHRERIEDAVFRHAVDLLDAGEGPNRYNPPGTHSHSTPLHQAALAGHFEVLKLLVQRGARLDVKDTIWQGTPEDWARHAGKAEVAEYLQLFNGREGQT